jgi:glycosyltransferase involved in cell wall biosynthesis
VDVAQALGRPMIMDVHDYFPVCPRLNLLDFGGKFCDLPATETCDECLSTAGIPAGSQDRRRNLMRHVLKSVNRIRFICESSRELVERVLPCAEDNVIVRGIAIPTCPPPPPPDAPPPLRVAVIGTLAQNKGAGVLLDTARQLASERIEFDFAGVVAPECENQLKVLQATGVKIKVRGRYQPEQIPEILHGKHVALFASPWPETFCITLSEAFRAGVVPVVSNLGALGERVQNGRNGLVGPAEAGFFVRALRSLLHDPQQLNRLREGALATPLPTLEEEIAFMRQLYFTLADEYGLPASKRSPSLHAACLAPIQTVCIGVPESPQGFNPARTLVRRAIRLYRERGLKVVLHRTWSRMKTGS